MVCALSPEEAAGAMNARAVNRWDERMYASKMQLARLCGCCARAEFARTTDSVGLAATVTCYPLPMLGRWTNLRALAVLLLLIGCQTRPDTPPTPWWAPIVDRCENHELDACSALQQEALRSYGNKALDRIGHRAATVGCELNDARSCHLLSIFETSPSGRRKSHERSCELGDADDCARLWRAHTWGDPSLGLSASVASGLEWAERACRVDPGIYGSYCSKRAWAFKDDPSLATSEDEVDRALALALCVPRDLSEADCDTAVAVARMSRHEWFGDSFIHPDRARALVSKRCDEGLLDACYLVGLLRFRVGNEERDANAGLSVWEPACDRGHKESCTMVARLRLVRGDRYAPKEAVERFREACRGDGHCLGTAARILAYKREYRAAAPFLREACDAGLSWACADAGRLRVLMKQPVAELEPALVSSCDRECKESCLALARAYELGLGVKRQPALAAKYRRRAHDLRLSTRYWNSMQRAVEGKGSDLDNVNALASIASLMPMVLAGLASATDLPWDFSEVSYADPW